MGRGLGHCPAHLCPSQVSYDCHSLVSGRGDMCPLRSSACLYPWTGLSKDPGARGATWPLPLFLAHPWSCLPGASQLSCVKEQMDIYPLQAS